MKCVALWRFSHVFLPKYYYFNDLQKNLRRILPTRAPKKTAMARPPKKIMQDRSFSHTPAAISADRSFLRKRKAMIHNPRKTIMAIKDNALMDLPVQLRSPCRSLGSPSIRRLIVLVRLSEVFILRDSCFSR
jgi:hypothetical protein